ncbi:UDP-glucosyltransferase 2-like [Schistocerca americana]|uniref:UDP-glucosyltransferase 2-like n=1 Tax=Schistocerca americana TaxID=7009 RepID=UPI001F501E65|nr:UDP-glucosyltransferase 2-like [Schistocerca americana]
MQSGAFDKVVDGGVDELSVSYLMESLTMAMIQMLCRTHKTATAWRSVQLMELREVDMVAARWVQQFIVGEGEEASYGIDSLARAPRMRPTSWLAICSAVALASAPTEAANILAATSVPGRSHFIMFRRLFKALASRGHNVTVVGHYPVDSPMENYTDISFKGDVPEADSNMPSAVINLLRMPFAGPVFLKNINRQLCAKVYDLPQMRRLASSGSRFDLVISEDFVHDCMAALAHKFRAPLVAISSSMALNGAHDRVGNPDHPAYTEQCLVPLKAPFSFWERVYSTVMHVYVRAVDWLMSGGYVDQKLREVLGADTPPLEQIIRNTSLVLINSHWSVDQPVPSVPAFVEVGGLHVEDPKPLPKDLQSFLDNSPQGVIYFSFGSLVQPDDLPEEKFKAILDALASVPQNVLWKVDPAALPHLPRNVRAQKWMPQNDVLYHPNVRVFITHGGLLGTQEGIMAGVPLLVVPLFSDQELNGVRVAAAGNGVRVRYEDLTFQALRSAIDTLVNDTRYSERAKQLSSLYRDRPRPPLEEAVYWVEYVLRHKGAPHLRSAVLDLAWYQYLLLDVAAFVVAAASLPLLALYFIVRNVVRSHKNDNKVKKQ